MDRRQIFTLAAVAMPAAIAALRTNILHARESEIYDIIRTIIDTKALTDDLQTYRQFRWGAFTYITLVDFFGAPDGRNADTDRQRIHLQALMPRQFADWRNRHAPEIYYLASAYDEVLAEAMNELLNENSPTYTEWLQSIGIVPWSRIARIILSGQVLATLAGLVEAGARAGVGQVDDLIEQIQRIELCFYPISRCGN